MIGGQWPVQQPIQQAQSGMTWADEMEVDNEDRSLPLSMQVNLGRPEGQPSKKKSKGKRNATPRSGGRKEFPKIYHEVEEKHQVLLNTLKQVHSGPRSCYEPIGSSDV